MLQAQEQQAIGRILTAVAEYKASDLHLTVGNPPILRVEGALKSLEQEGVMTPETLQSLVDGLLSDEQKTELKTFKDVTLSYSFQDRIRFRMNVFYQKGYPALSLRFIPERIPTPEELGLPHAIESFANLQSGLLLIVGPFGSGKTTTTASLLQKINNERTEHIVTIENPIEYMFLNNKSIIEQREVGRDTTSVLRALQFAEHEDVDIIVIAGMRGSDVMHKVLELSRSDRLVIATLGSDSIVHALDMIVTSYPEDLRSSACATLSEVVQGVVGQRLVSRIGGGQVLVPELLIPTTAARANIRDNQFQQLITIMQTSRDLGMISRDRVLAEYVQNGVVTPEEARSHAYDPDQFSLMINR